MKIINAQTVPALFGVSALALLTGCPIAGLPEDPNSYRLSGNISGLDGVIQISSRVKTYIVENSSNIESINVEADRSFTFEHLTSNKSDSFEVTSQPLGQVCVITDRGTQQYSDEPNIIDIVNIQVVCSNNPYTKISSAGVDLPDDATDWQCVRDGTTGLVWEAKTDDGGLHDKNWIYLDTTNNKDNYDPRDDNEDGGLCLASTDANDGIYCHTEGYVADVNATGQCGSTDWRMPTEAELRTIIYCSNGFIAELDSGCAINYVERGTYISPTINTEYFPHILTNIGTTNIGTMTSGETAYWGISVDFTDGSRASIHDFGGYVRLVHSAE